MTKISLSPFGNRVIVKVHDKETMSRGGIALPPSAQGINQTSKGLVVAVGPGRYTHNGDLIPCEAKVGDTVLLPEFGRGQLIDVDGVEYLQIPDEAIIGRI